jgi:menaquinone-dependent protoporphyrinogen IX oxidase
MNVSAAALPTVRWKCAAIQAVLWAKASPKQAAEYVEGFLRETRLSPAFIQSFAGAMAYTKYRFFLRWITKLISWRRGGPTDTSQDHDMTDWRAVDQFAKRLAETLPPSPQRDMVESVPLQSGSSFAKTSHKT